MKSRKAILLTSGAALAITLAGGNASAQSAQEDEIITTGVISTAGTNRIDTSISVSSVDLEQIQATNPTNLAEIFRQMPGMRSESSSGGGNSNINVRGIPISTGGAKYLSIQEDGLPVLLFGDHLFAPADGFVKADATLARVESVRGGTASTLTTNGAGGIINIIGKTGRDEGGSAALLFGLDYDDMRIDAEYGGALSDDMYYHIGGHFQQGGDYRDSDFDAISGGQIRATVTKEFENGFVRLTGKWLDKKDAAYFPQLVSRTDNGSNVGTVGTSLGRFEANSDSIYSNYTRYGTAVNGRGEIEPYDLANGLHHKVKAVGAHLNFDLGSGITLDNKTRYQDISGEFLGGFTNGVTLGSDFDAGGSLAGSTYFNGPNAGAGVTSSNLPNGVASNVAVFDVNIDDMSNFANELRLSKSFGLEGGSTLDFTFGHFFMNQQFVQDWHWSELRTTTDNNALLIQTPQAINGIHGPNQAFGWDGSNRNYDLEAEVSSPFVAASWTNGVLTLDGSVRFDNMKQVGRRLEAAGGPVDLNGDNAITGAEATVSLNTGAVGAIANFEVDNTAYSFGANYMVRDDLAVFGRISSGASFNFDRALDFGVRDAGGGLISGGDEAYVDEVNQYEAGVKWQNAAIAGGEVDLYGTVFFSDTEESNITITPPSGQVREYEAKGIEVESYYTRGNFDLYATATYTDAEIVGAADASGTPNNAILGNKPQRQADWIWAVTPSLRFLDDRARVSGSWVGTTDSFANDTNNLTQEGYSVVHLTGAYAITEQLEVSLNVNNLFDADGITESANDGRDGWDTTGDGRLDTTIGRSILGRTTSATLRYRF